MEIVAGKVFEVDCPFIRQAYHDFDEDGPYTTLTWNPGVVWEMSGPEDADPRAHGMGKVIYAVVEVVRLPRPYPARVFFTRQWINPDGRKFGRHSLKVMTLDAFRRRAARARFWHCEKRVGTMERGGFTEDEPGHIMLGYSELGISSAPKKTASAPLRSAAEHRRDLIAARTEAHFKAKELL